MRKTIRDLIVFILGSGYICNLCAQDTLHHPRAGMKPASGADSTYIKTFTLPNDIRLILGGQSSGLEFQSTRDENLEVHLESYNNVSDLIGFGLTYKVIDFDLMFSLPGTTLLPDARRNLDQIRLSVSYTGRKYSFRAYINESTGVISTDPVSDYQSSPDVHLLKVGGQITHIFNSSRYSYRAANFQSEIQLKTAGSFLLRCEPFYREFGLSSVALVPSSRNTREVLGDQSGLQSVYAPAVVLMPGYGYTFVRNEGKFYLAPMALAGPGVALNTYKSDAGAVRTLNFEATGAISLNTGYNGKLVYCNLRFSCDLSYSYLDPSFFTTIYNKLYITVGYRFRHLENVIPTSFF